MKVRVIGYTRVSSDDQAHSGLGFEAQEAAIRAEASRRGWDVVAVMSDPAVSGKVRPDDRAGFSSVMSAFSAENADVLLVAKLDRLSRSLAHLAALADDFGRRGWGLVAADSPSLDTTTATGRLTFNLLGSVAEWERMVIGERTKAALAAKKARGERLGRPVTLPAATRARIASERASGRTLTAIADDLNAEQVPTARGGRWYPSTIAGVLRSIELDSLAVAPAS